MSRISDMDLAIAAKWLRCNDGDDGESDACARVADWLDAERKRRSDEAILRKAARECGVSPAVARKALIRRRAMIAAQEQK